MSTDLIELWHQRARPNPDQRAFDVQFGCHLEEIVEMLETVCLTPSTYQLSTEQPADDTEGAPCERTADRQQDR